MSARSGPGWIRRAWDGLNTALEILADLTGVGFTTRRRDRSRGPHNDVMKEDGR